MFWGLTYASLIGGIITIVGGVLSDVTKRKYAFLYYSLLGIILAYPLAAVLRISFALLVVSAGILSSVIGTGGVMLAYLAELFPTRYRGSAIGFIWNMASIGATAALLTAPFWLRLGLIIGYSVMLIVGS
ncbi:hypothetical protein [Vulcanisaeta souniana]|uniref:hypothetical protein n=1 Tax=Vulcanisaeta souniana TaxID=164452 RepID=UPI001FB54FEB|nr:hypothetical protein [Vulcanisaeta souniana]